MLGRAAKAGGRGNEDRAIEDELSFGEGACRDQGGESLDLDVMAH